MGFFDDVKDKMGDVAKKTEELARIAARKSGDLLEIGKLKLKIQEEKNAIKNEQQEIGAIVYEKYAKTAKASVPAEILSHVVSIKTRQETIQDLLKRIEEIKEENGDISEEDFADFEEDMTPQAPKVLEGTVEMPKEVVSFGVDLTKKDEDSEQNPQ